MSLHDFYLQSRQSATHQVWTFSDLQQTDPDLAEQCLTIAVEDMKEIGADFTHLWYLGDATEGSNPDHTRRMTDMQVKLLGSLNIPLRFIMGNHDLDPTRGLPPGSTPVLPAYEAFRKVPGWKTTETPMDIAFTEILGETLVVFLSDHVSPDCRWFATQQGICGEFPEEYSHELKVYQQLRKKMADWPGPVVIAGHYAFPGGARGTQEGGLPERLLPLPESVKLVLHGHAHIGDLKWGKKDTYQRVSWVDWHQIPLANISSLDRRRGSQTRSSVLHLQPDGTLALFFRDHEDARWSDALFTDATAPRSRSGISAAFHKERNALQGTDLERWQQQHDG